MDAQSTDKTNDEKSNPIQLRWASGTRSSTSCQQCRARHVECDGRKPKCLNREHVSLRCWGDGPEYSVTDSATVSVPTSFAPTPDISAMNAAQRLRISEGVQAEDPSLLFLGTTSNTAGPRARQSSSSHLPARINLGAAKLAKSGRNAAIAAAKDAHSKTQQHPLKRKAADKHLDVSSSDTVPDIPEAAASTQSRALQDVAANVLNQMDTSSEELKKRRKTTIDIGKLIGPDDEARVVNSSNDKDGSSCHLKAEQVSDEMRQYA